MEVTNLLVESQLTFVHLQNGFVESQPDGFGERAARSFDMTAASSALDGWQRWRSNRSRRKRGMVVVVVAVVVRRRIGILGWGDGVVLGKWAE